MASELSSMMLHAETLGSAQEVATFLNDIDEAYVNIYAFDLIVESLSVERDTQIKWREEWFHTWRIFWKDYGMRKELPPDPFFFEFFYRELLSHRDPSHKKELFQYTRQFDLRTLVIAGDELQIKRINIASPGFWEFLGAANPLHQIREYLKDRHERSKDNRYRSRQEEELADLQIAEKRDNLLSGRIAILRNVGYSDAEIRQMVSQMVISPLNKLGKHQDAGRIGEPE